MKSPQSVSKFKNNDKEIDMFKVVAKNFWYGEIIEIDSDQLIVATGRIPNTSMFDLKIKSKDY